MEVLGLLEVPTTWIICIAVLILLYIYGMSGFSVLSDAGITGPRPWPYLGNFPLLITQGLNFDNPLQGSYGKVFGMYFGSVPAVIVTDPEVIREILVKEFSQFTDRWTIDLDDYPLKMGMFFQKGCVWKRLRTISSPTFSGLKLRLMCDRINTCSRALTANFVNAAEKNSVIDIKDYFGAFTLDAIASTAFGIDIDSQNDFNNAFVREAKRIFADVSISSPVSMLALIFPRSAPMFKRLGFSQFNKTSMRFLSQSLQEMVDQRKLETGEHKHVDFLQLLIEAEDTGTEDGTDGVNNKKKMSADEILGQALLFFVAGYETTATALHFAAYSLARNPDVQTRLTEEIDSVLGNKEPDYDNIGELPYLDHVINETLRMYPSVPFLNRFVDKTVTVKGHTFPKGCFISIPALTMHRNKDLYAEPNMFKPERWERKSEMDPMAYLAFGRGPRNCIGMRLALVEMKMALAQVLKKIQFVPAPETKERLDSEDFKVGGVFTVKKPIKLKVQRR